MTSRKTLLFHPKNWLPTLIFLGSGLHSMGQPPEPDFVVHGLMNFGCGGLTVEDHIVVEARKLDETVIANYLMASDEGLGPYYVLRIPMSSVTQPTTAIGGEGLNIVVRNELGETLFSEPLTVSQPGHFAELELGDGQASDPADAGDDQSVCSQSTALDANDPIFGTGTWSIVSGAGGVLEDPNDPKTQFTGEFGQTYVLEWTIVAGGCPPDTDGVVITFIEELSVADAGADLNICGTSTQLAANTPHFGTAHWEIVSGGTGSFDDPLDPYTTFHGQAGVTYVLRWIISAGDCPDSTDDVLVTLNPANSPELSILGPDTAYCAQWTTLVASEGYDTYSWSNGATTRIIQVSGIGSTVYTVRAELNNGCERIASHRVAFVPEDPSQVEVIVDLSSHSMCQVGEPFVLRSLGACGGEPPFSFEWILVSSPPEGGVIASPFQSETTLTPYGLGTYTIQLVVQDALGATNTVEFTLTVPLLEDNDQNGVFDQADWFFRLTHWQADVTVFPWLDANLDGHLDVRDMLVAYPCESAY